MNYSFFVVCLCVLMAVWSGMFCMERNFNFEYCSRSLQSVSFMLTLILDSIDLCCSCSAVISLDLCKGSHSLAKFLTDHGGICCVVKRN